MKRSKRLLAMLAALIIVIGAAAAATLLSTEDEHATTDASVTVFTLDTESTSALSWTRNGVTIALDKQGDDWNYTADAQFPLDALQVDVVLDALAEITTDKTIVEPEDTAQYGLDEPTCTIQITADTESELCIGSETTIGGQHYLSTGDGNVYLVASSILDYFTDDLYDLVQEEPIPSMYDLNTLQVQNNAGSLTLQHLPDNDLTYSSSYVWFSPEDDGYVTLDTELVDTFTGTLAGMSWTQCVDYNATAEELAEYGLDDPAGIVTANYNKTIEVQTGETDDEGNPVTEPQTVEAVFTLELGNYIDSACYAKLADSSMVYLVDASLADTLLHTELSELLPDDVLKMDWDTVTSIDITIDGAVHTVDVALEPHTDDDGNTSEETVYRLDGEPIDLGDLKIELNDMIGFDYYTAAPTGSEMLRFVFHRSTDQYSEIELCFYEYDSSSCVVTLNEQRTVLVTRNNVADLTDCVLALLP